MHAARAAEVCPPSSQSAFCDFHFINEDASGGGRLSAWHGRPIAARATEGCLRCVERPWCTAQHADIDFSWPSTSSYARRSLVARGMKKDARPSTSHCRQLSKEHHCRGPPSRPRPPTVADGGCVCCVTAGRRRSGSHAVCGVGRPSGSGWSGVRTPVIAEGSQPISPPLTGYRGIPLGGVLAV